MTDKEKYFNHLLKICGKDKERKKEFIKEAYKVALDTRKFEIDLYWRRAAYFWAFIVAIFVAYFASYKEGLDVISVALALLGFLFSLGWHMVVRGSKVWQENWEMHISYLEEEVHGPLFKILTTPRMNFWKFQEEYPFSVSKVNQVLSVYVSVFWLCMFIYSLISLLPETLISYFKENKCEVCLVDSISVFFIFIIIFGFSSYYLFSKSKSFHTKR